MIKFVEPCQLATKAQKPVLHLLDVCYGLGYNTAAALEVIWENNPNCCVDLVALEINLDVPKEAIAQDLLNNYKQPIPQLLENLITDLQVKTAQFQAQLYLGDARITVQQLSQQKFLADAIFLDPFSPPHCPQLWTVEFLQQLANCCAKDGKLPLIPVPQRYEVLCWQQDLKLVEPHKLEVGYPEQLVVLMILIYYPYQSDPKNIYKLVPLCLIMTLSLITQKRLFCSSAKLSNKHLL